VTLVALSATDLKAAVGKPLGPTAWIVLSRRKIDLFAEATGDYGGIHVIPDHELKKSFGGTIAPGFLTASLVGKFLSELMDVRGLKMAINYGADKIRFPTPVMEGSYVRAAATLLSAKDLADEAVQVLMRINIEIEGRNKPACIVDKITRYYFA
jgi:acyl dehydratase